MDNQKATDATLSSRLTAIEERLSLLERVVGSFASKQSGVGQSSPEARVLAPAPAVRPAPAKRMQTTELEIGQKWISVVGVVLVFLAVLFFVNYVFQFMGPLGKVALSYAGAALLFGVSFFTQKKYPPFSAIVGAGAWGVTYLVTYAMHFFPATRLITSPALAMFLLVLVVIALLALAVTRKVKTLIVLALFLGFLTAIVSPLSLFSIACTVLLLMVLVAVATLLPWGDLLFPAAIGAYVSYYFWFSGLRGYLPAQGGGELEKHFIGLVSLLIMWITLSVGLLLRKEDKDSESFGGHTDTLTMLLSGATTVFLGLGSLHVLMPDAPRTVTGTWLLIFAGLYGGLTMALNAYRGKKDVVTISGLLSLLLLLASIVFFFPDGSRGVSIAWAVLGLLLVVAGSGARTPALGAMSLVPLIASVVRFISNDLYSGVPGTSTLSPTLLVGVLNAAIIVGSSVLLRLVDVTTLKDPRAKRLPGVLLAAAIVVLYLVTDHEFTAAVPSVLWSIIGLVTVVAGFLAHWKDARLVGLAALAIAVVRVFVHDLSDLEILPRVISFAVLGGLLLLIGYGYSRNREKLQKLLEEE